MKRISLGDINILDVGNDIQMAGVVWSSNDLCFVTLIPNKDESDLKNMKLMPMSLDEWKRFLRQTDVLETEILVNDDGKIKKAVYRKSQRQIDKRIQWAVFQRDIGWKPRRY